MDNSLRALCDAIKKVIPRLKPQTNQLSFIIVTGKKNQGKSALLKQGQLEEMPVFSEQHAKIYFNHRGIIVELGEAWLINSKTIVQNTIKQLNRCSHYLKITGLILCIDVNELLIPDPIECAERKTAHLQLLHRLGVNLGYPAELALIFTKMDTLAGFTEFYQTDHATELAKPMGFSLDCMNQLKKKMEAYTIQFNHLIELLGHDLIRKMHPVRSTIKRSLIREFPLQLASLRTPAQMYIQGISPKLFNLHSIYFTSAEQGGVSVDRLNKKIHHEYGLMIQDTFPQATNFRAYFVEGALKNIQEQCSQIPQKRKFSQKPLVAIAGSLATLCILILGYNHFKTAHLLDEVSKELLTYDALNTQSHNQAQALYHLSKASNTVDHISSNALSRPTIHQLKLNLHYNAQNRLQEEFLPSLTNELEQAIMNPANTPIVRYKALKVYLMLNQPDHLVSSDVEEWFKNQWTDQGLKRFNKHVSLLRDTLNKPMHHVPIKERIISDARNYLNALPTSYLYYSIAKETFPTFKQKIAVQGFNLATNEVPIYFTKAGFEDLIHEIPKISTQLQAENWILERQDLSDLPNLLQQAYCYDYVTWWQTFMRKTQPVHYQDYQQGKQIIHQLQESNAIHELADLVRHETTPDLTDNNSLFNKLIAHQFTDLNLMSQSTTKELHNKIADLERFIATLSVLNDQGKTAFTITRSRFLNENASDPLSMLYSQAKQLPEPLSSWSKNIAGDTWSILIKDSRRYINLQWQHSVYQEFQTHIAKRYPFDSSQTEEISIENFNHFFSPNGALNTFSDNYIKPFLDVSSAEWKPRAVNDFVLPIAPETLDEIIRANIITNMFFPFRGNNSKIDFSLQKINLDPIVASIVLEIGKTKLSDTQTSDSSMHFSWPQSNAKLSLSSIEGNHYEIVEQGTWALFKLLEKVNVLVDEQDSSSLQILFEINSNSGRYLLKTNNQINPFTPGILNGFSLSEVIM